MIAEFTVGTSFKRQVRDVAYKVLAPGTHWKWLGYLGVFGRFSYSRILFGSGRMDFGIYIGSGNEWFCR